MSNERAEEEITPAETAFYIADMAEELARLAREAGLVTVAAELEQSQRAALAEGRARQSGGAKAAPEDAR